jgi:hypothetical protein
MKQELRLLKDIIQENCPEEYNYEPEVGSRKARKSDYALVTVIPVSDPNAATMSQKVVQYQAVLQLAQSAPQLYNLPLLHRQMIEILGIKNADKLVPMEEDKKPEDPSPCTVELSDGCTVERKPRVPRPSNVEFRVGCMEDTDDKKPNDPRPWIVELIVSLSPAEDKKPRDPSPTSVEFRVG